MAKKSKRQKQIEQEYQRRVKTIETQTTVHETGEKGTPALVQSEAVKKTLDMEHIQRLRNESEQELTQHITWEDDPVIAIYDVRGIQDYIFKTNKLKEIVGASLIVRDIFTATLKTVVSQYYPDYLDHMVLDWRNAPPYQFDDWDGILLEVINSSAGNTTVLYRTGRLCHEINKHLSLLIIKNTYSLNLAIAFTKKTDNYADDYYKLRKKLGAIKAKMDFVSFCGALPVVRTDLYSGPLSENFNHEWVSKESCAKLNVYYRKKAETTGDEGNFANELEFDKMKADKNLAIVHIDGNGVGSYISSVMDGVANYKEAVKKLRGVSKDINTSFNETPVNEMKKQLKAWLSSQKCPWKPGNEQLEKSYFREIINAGDDITFVCAAEIAISLCNIYLNELKKVNDNRRTTEDSESSKEFKEFRASAGIAFIGSHFPFSRGYDIAESCCNNAKNAARAYGSGQPGCWIDFQIVRSMFLDLQDYRDKHYTYATPEGGWINLLSRPYCVDEDNNTLASLQSYLDFFSGAPRSWAKELRNAYQAGVSNTELVRDKMASRGYKLPDEPFVDSGVTENRTGMKIRRAVYFDALEMMDYFVPIVNPVMMGGADNVQAEDNAAI